MPCCGIASRSTGSSRLDGSEGASNLCAMMAASSHEPERGGPRGLDPRLSRLLEALERISADQADALIAEAIAEVRDRVRPLVRRALIEALTEGLSGLPGTDALDSPAPIPAPLAPTEHPFNDRPSPAWWVFGVTDADEPVAKNLTAFQPDGPVRTIRAGRLKAIVALVTLGGEEGAADASPGPEERAALASRAVVHDRVLRTVVRPEAVVPFRFGTTLASEAAVQRMLDEWTDPLARALDEVRGRAEWTVRLSVNLATLEQRMDEGSAKVGRLQAMAGTQGPGGHHLLDRAAERERRREAAHLRAAVAKRTRAALERQAVRTLAGRLLPPNENDTEVPVMRASCLVEVSGVQGFLRTAEDLKPALAPFGFRLRIDGPLPPYSFVPTLPIGSEPSEVGR